MNVLWTNITARRAFLRKSDPFSGNTTVVNAPNCAGLAGSAHLTAPHAVYFEALRRVRSEPRRCVHSQVGLHSASRIQPAHQVFRVRYLERSVLLVRSHLQKKAPVVGSQTSPTLRDGLHYSNCRFDTAANRYLCLCRHFRRVPRIDHHSRSYPPQTFDPVPSSRLRLFRLPMSGHYRHSLVPL